MIQELLTLNDSFFSKTKKESIEFSKIFNEYRKVIETLISCTSFDQIITTENLFYNFRKKWDFSAKKLDCVTLDSFLTYVDRDFTAQLEITKSNLNK